MNDVMLDLETFGVRPGCVIRSVAAVEFTLDGKLGDKFYANVDRTSCERALLKIEPKAKVWWDDQTDAAQALLMIDPKPLAEVVLSFKRWFHSDARLWAHGAAFDPPIWEAAMNAIGELAPWKFWQVRDTRTAFDLLGFDPREITRDTLAHSAMDDAKWQIECLAAAIKRRSAMFQADVMA